VNGVVAGVATGLVVGGGALGCCKEGVCCVCTEGSGAAVVSDPSIPSTGRAFMTGIGVGVVNGAVGGSARRTSGSPELFGGGWAGNWACNLEQRVNPTRMPLRMGARMEM